MTTPVDLDDLRARFLIEDDAETVAMLDCFINSARDVLNDLAKAVEERNWETVRERAHAAKGAAANASASHLSELCRSIEEQAPGRDWPKIETLTEDAAHALSAIGEQTALLTKGVSTHDFSN